MISYVTNFDDEYLQLILFNRNLFADIRLLIINEFIFKKFSLKLNSIENIKLFFTIIKVKQTKQSFIQNVELFSFSFCQRTTSTLILFEVYLVHMQII